MKTLIFNGSPRKNGDTVSLINIILEDLKGEYSLVNAYDCNISPCIDCRYCRENPGCAVNDGMQEVYEYIRDCDNIIIASPVHFSELTGKLLCVGSRLQAFDCAECFRNEKPFIRPKKGGIVLAGGGAGKPDRAVQTARILLHSMNCVRIYESVCSLNTDRIPAADDINVAGQLHGLAAFLNGQRGMAVTEAGQV